jgi:hypothetical protein
MNWPCKECLVQPLCKTPCEKFMKETPPTMRDTRPKIEKCKRFYRGPMGCIPSVNVCLDCGSFVHDGWFELLKENNAIEVLNPGG